MTETTHNAEAPASDPGMEGNVTLREPTPEERIAHLESECENLRVIRDRQITTIKDLREHLAQREQFITDLGEALREEALKREWCEEYDSFADDWGLPKRFLKYEVTMTVTVTAADEESAIEMVKGQVDISSYSEGVTDGPEFEVSEE